MTERVLVTGGSGYFGSLLVERLLADGSCGAGAGPPRRTGTPTWRCSAGTSATPTSWAGRSAARPGSSTTWPRCRLARDRALFESVNVGGTATLLEACLAAGVDKVVHTSSSAVFGVPETNPVTTDTPPRPVEAYGRAKADAELLCRAAVTRGLDVTVVRPRTILGHGRLGIFGILFDWIADGADVPVLGDGRNVYQFVHADDLAAAILSAAERPGSETYNIGAEEFGTMGDAVAHLCAHAGTGSRVRHLPVGADQSGDGVVGPTRTDAVRSVPLDHVQPVVVVRRGSGQGRPGLVGRLVDRRDVPGLLRVVPRAPARRRRWLGPSQPGSPGSPAPGQARARRRVLSAGRARRRRGPSTPPPAPGGRGPSTRCRPAPRPRRRRQRRRTGAPPARRAPWR